MRRLRGGMEVRWQLPFIFRALTVNKYDSAHLSWPHCNKELYCCCYTDSDPYGSFISEKEPVLRPGGERKTERGSERGQSCGGHILQRHIYYFTTALGKEAALGLCSTHSTIDNHWGKLCEHWRAGIKCSRRNHFLNVFIYLFLSSIACSIVGVHFYETVLGVRLRNYIK